MARLSTLKAAIVQSTSTSLMECKDNLKPRLLGLPEIPRGLLEESKGILSHMTQFGSESIRRLVAVFSTVEAIQHIKSPIGFLEGASGRNRLDSVVHDVTHKKNGAKTIKSIPSDLISSLSGSVNRGISSVSLAIDSLRKMLVKHEYENDISGNAEAIGVVGVNGVFGYPDISKVEVVALVLGTNETQFLTDPQEVSVSTDFLAERPKKVAKYMGTDVKKLVDLESDVDILSDCTEAEFEELLDISTVYNDLVGSFKKIRFMVNRLEHRIDLIVTMIYRWMGNAGVNLGGEATGAAVKSGLAALDLYSELISDRALHKRLFGGAAVSLSDHELSAVSKEFKGVSRDIDRLFALIDRLINVDALKLIEINKYYDNHVNLSGCSQKFLSEFREGLGGLNGLLDEALSHVKHVHGVVAPIAVTVSNFNHGLIEELRHGLMEAHSKVIAAQEGL